MKKLLAVLVLGFSLNSYGAEIDEYYYNIGKEHGCQSGKKAGGDWWVSYKKEVNLYMEQNYYKTGWDDGFNLCRGEAQNLNNMIMNNMGY